MPGGVDVSFGQWQKLALARGFMRDHALLSSWTNRPPLSMPKRARAVRALCRSRQPPINGRSHSPSRAHRFSTVRMADLIVVLDGAASSKFGAHDALVRKAATMRTSTLSRLRRTLTPPWRAGHASSGLRAVGHFLVSYLMKQHLPICGEGHTPCGINQLELIAHSRK